MGLRYALSEEDNDEDVRPDKSVRKSALGSPGAQWGIQEECQSSSATAGRISPTPLWIISDHSSRAVVFFVILYADEPSLLCCLIASVKKGRDCVTHGHEGFFPGEVDNVEHEHGLDWSVGQLVVQCWVYEKLSGDLEHSNKKSRIGSGSYKS